MHVTALQPEVSFPLAALGLMRLESPAGRAVDLVADGSRLTLNVPGRAELLALTPRSMRARSRMIRSMARILSTSGLVFSLEFDGKPVFQLGRDIRPSLLARLLGLAPARITLASIRLIFRRQAQI